MADNIVNGVHGCTAEESYVKPTDSLLLERLEWFQDQKLAFMMHYGLYSQLGIMESWPLSDEESSWSRREVDWVDDVKTFRDQYVNTNRGFNPVRFQPDKWAAFAKKNGFRYVIFTTKHHDGFCMYDSKYTDYKLTAKDCPFHTHKYADMSRHLFDAFRKEGLGIGAYFSKPDWHCPWYWAEGMDRPVGHDRFPTYTPSEHPELWDKYVEFTHNQMLELVENYGPLDILWLDGGQVNPALGLDIRMAEVVNKARKKQPGLLTADRTVGGEFENYITPEQSLPPEPIRVPWETCITVGRGWGYRYQDCYKTSRELVKLLVSVVCRGGNLALNVGPAPNGQLPPEALKVLEGLGDWLRDNGEAIYGTRLADPHEAGNTAFTKKGDIYYAIERLEEGETLPESLHIAWPYEVGKITLLGLGTEVPFQRAGNGIDIRLPYLLVGTNPLALAFRLEK